MSKAMDALDELAPREDQFDECQAKAYETLRDYITTTEAGREDVETETIDRLFLELSQFTKAKTGRELQREARIKELEEAPKLFEKDPHQFSTRPCGTCAELTAILGRPFGCDAKRKRDEDAKPALSGARKGEL